MPRPNRILVPSADHAGSPSPVPSSYSPLAASSLPPSVRRHSPEPSSSMRKMLLLHTGGGGASPGSVMSGTTWPPLTQSPDENTTVAPALPGAASEATRATVLATPTRSLPRMSGRIVALQRSRCADWLVTRDAQLFVPHPHHIAGVQLASAPLLGLAVHEHRFRGQQVLRLAATADQAGELEQLAEPDCVASDVNIRG